MAAVAKLQMNICDYKEKQLAFFIFRTALDCIFLMFSSVYVASSHKNMIGQMIGQILTHLISSVVGIFQLDFYAALFSSSIPFILKENLKEKLS